MVTVPDLVPAKVGVNLTLSVQEAARQQRTAAVVALVKVAGANDTAELQSVPPVFFSVANLAALVVPPPEHKSKARGESPLVWIPQESGRRSQGGTIACADCLPLAGNRKSAGLRPCGRGFESHVERPCGAWIYLEPHYWSWSRPP